MSAFEKAWDVTKAKLPPLSLDDSFMYRRPSYLNKDGPSDDYMLRIPAELALEILRNSDPYVNSTEPVEFGGQREYRGPRAIGARRAVRDIEDRPSILENLGNVFSRTSTSGSMGGSGDYAPYDIIEALLAREGGPVERFLQDKIDEDDMVDVGWLEVGRPENKSKAGKIMAMMRMPGFGRADMGDFQFDDNIMQHLLAAAINDRGFLYDKTWSPEGAGLISRLGSEMIADDDKPRSRIRTLGELIGTDSDQEVLSREGFGHSLFQDTARAFRFPYSRMAGRSFATRFGSDELEDALRVYGERELFHDDGDWRSDSEDDFDMTSSGKIIVHEKPESFPYHRTLGIASLGDGPSATPHSLQRYDYDEEQGGFLPKFVRIEDVDPR